MDLGSGNGNKKKKLWLGIVGGIIGALFPIVIIPAVITSGIMAVAEFVIGIGEKIVGFFGPDDLLAELGDETSITEKDLEGWMITRNSMCYLLVKAEEFNNREPRTKTFEIEGRKTWTEYVPVPTATPIPTPTPEAEEEAGEESVTPVPTVTKKPTATPTVTPVPVITYKEVYHDEKEITPVKITEDRTLIDRYKVSWQLAYMLCIYKYMDAYESQDMIFDIPTSEIDILFDELEPYIVYEFDPITYWPIKKRLTEDDVEQHPHKDIYYTETVMDSTIKDNAIHHKRIIPRMKVKEVWLPYGKDVYEYKYIPVGDGVWEEVLTYRREYDKEKFLRIIEPYLGEREVDAFMAAFELMPDVEDLYLELERVLGME